MLQKHLSGCSPPLPSTLPPPLTSRVCSNCALREPSEVTAVHPSGQSRSFHDPGKVRRREERDEVRFRVGGQGMVECSRVGERRHRHPHQALQCSLERPRPSGAELQSGGGGRPLSLHSAARCTAVLTSVDHWLDGEDLPSLHQPSGLVLWQAGGRVAKSRITTNESNDKR